ncbi:cupin domain-containing protein [Natrarchaeobius sp. A-rgal3]|uniref:cupin domain-containing protein n=1 Tax=Natrarchaeobius versutus TaxID=1679078 RepID=UPI00350EE504
MGYDTAAKADPESVVPAEFGGMWFLREELETTALGFTVLELEPEASGKEHDETESDQEEIYYVVSGTVDVELPDAEETVSLESEDAIRIDPEERRQIHNRGDERATLVLAGAPR